jgi:hypothetical protein
MSNHSVTVLVLYLSRFNSLNVTLLIPSASFRTAKVGGKKSSALRAAGSLHQSQLSLCTCLYLKHVTREPYRNGDSGLMQRSLH